MTFVLAAGFFLRHGVEDLFTLDVPLLVHGLGVLMLSDVSGVLASLLCLYSVRVIFLDPEVNISALELLSKPLSKPLSKLPSESDLE